MAKLTVTVTVTATVLLLTFVLSGASSVSSTPGNDFTAESLTTLSAEPDPDSTIPDLTGSGSDSVPKITSSGETTGREPELPSSDEINVPVNFMNFHPINRHFPRRPLTMASFNRRPCRFHHHRRHELLGESVKIPYGRDMISSGEEKTTHTDHWPHGVVSDFAFTEMLVSSDASDERKEKITVMTAKHHSSNYVFRHEEQDHAIEINNFGEGEGESEAEESSFMGIPATRVKLIKYEGKHKKEHKDVLMRKIRKFLNHMI